MKVLAIRADDGACAKYRIVEPANAVNKLGGVDVTVDTGVDGVAYENKVTKMVEVKELHVDADVLVIQRPLNNSSVGIIQQAKRQGIATVVELDDDYGYVSPHNAAYGAMYGKEHTNAEWVTKACREADWVTVSTQALLKYAPKKHGSILRNYVPESIFDVTPRYESVSDPEIVGWSGIIANHPHDLEETNGRVGLFVDHNNMKFGVVGDGEGVPSKLKLPMGTSFLTTGWVSLDKYYQTMARTMDLGIVPLERSPFNEAKSHLKGIEMASLGIPFVASPTYEYTRLSTYGVGKIATTPNEWYKHLERWKSSPDKYLEDARTYREIIRESFTYEKNAHEWVKAWEIAIKRRKASSKS